MKHCNKCSRDLDESMFCSNRSNKDGLNDYCKECVKNYRLPFKDKLNEYCRNYQAKRANDFEYIIKNRWASILQRCINSKYSQGKTASKNFQQASYLKQNILLEMTYEEFTAWMFSQKELFDEISEFTKAVVSRINPTKNYSVDNLEIISREDSFEKRWGTPCNSMTEEQKADKKIINSNRYKKSQGDEK